LWRGFVGSVVESNDARLVPGSTVIGIAQTQVSNRIVCHSGQVALLSSTAVDDRLAEHALAMVIAAIALGSKRMSNPTLALPSMKILIAGEDEVSKALFKFLELLPSFAHVEIGSAPDDAKFDLIIVDSATLEARPEVAFWRAKLFIWDRVIRESLDIDPWCIGYSLECALRLAVPGTFSPDTQLIRPRNRSLDLSVLHSFGVALFQDSKAYMLIGGASDLGVHVALWMYQVSRVACCCSHAIDLPQNGARYIVLTSRRGRKFFDTNEYVPTHQKLAYLESRDDLCLRVEACDALSVEATAGVVRSCDLPLGGCFFMSVVLEDQLFIHQTKDTFRKVYDSKVTALETFNRVKSIETLDFMVFFSSSVALVGNVGQINYCV
jgi:hypothetical protein